MSTSAHVTTAGLLATVAMHLAPQQAPPPPTPVPLPSPTVQPAFREDFEGTAPRALPKGWTAAVTVQPKERGEVATWAVVEEAAAPDGKRVLQLGTSRNRGLVYNLCLRDEPAPADVAVSVKLRADGGLEDRGGGLVWRLKDVDNYYVCRWNPLEKNVGAYRVQAGRRLVLAMAAVDADPGAWQTLRAVMVGRVLQIEFNGRRVLSYADQALAEGGKVGVWTKADAVSSFDEFTVGAAPAEKAGR